jgi:hypothetical protein
MSALTEISLKNPDLLFSGKALEAVVAESVPAVRKPLDLYARDVDALLIYLRVATYGPEYRVEVKHDCEGAKNHSYVADLDRLIAEAKPLDPSLVERLRVVTTPTGQQVTVRPMRFRDVIELFHLSGPRQGELSPEDLRTLALANMLSMVESVDGTTDRNHLREWAQAISSPIVAQITDAASALNEWGPDSIVTLKCKDCGEPMRVELPMNPVSFFNG